jgi:hypothetical protein
MMTDPVMIQQTATTLFAPGTVAEMRILNTPRQGVVSGYFDHPAPFVQAAEQWSGKAPAVYATLNPCIPALLARSANRLKDRVKTTTSDKDIVTRCWFPIDFDPTRPADISATEAEHNAALHRAEACTTWLTARGWPAPVAADSGNGGHRLYRIDLPNDAASTDLLKRCLEALALYFSDQEVTLDLTVFNAARVWKVYGTMACKGDNLPERPHRLARLLDVPSPLACVTQQQLEDLAALLPAPAAAPPRRGMTPQGGSFDLRQWIAAHGVPVVAEGPWQQSGYRWVLNPCPWDGAHTNRSAFVVQFASGAIAAGCHHNGCHGNDWHALRTLYEPGWQPGSPPATFQVGGSPSATTNTSTPPPQGPASASAPGGIWSTPAWHSGLLRQKGGKPEQTINNFALALHNLDPWHSAGCWYDVVRERHMVGTKPVEDGDATVAGIVIEQATQIRVTNLALVGRALDHVCRQTTRDLLQEWVATLPKRRVTKLLTTWLRTYAHVPDVVSDAYVADVSRIIPVGIIARILHPGCQYRYVPILEGPENTGKSKLTKALAGHDPYGQSWHVPLSAGLENKEAHMMLDGALIAELEELSSYTKTDDNRMKALITAETDSFVPKFANKRVDHPRRTVFIATVNPEGDGAYLKGQSGNTRYLPIAVRDIDIKGFLKKRNQLFAEAKAYVLAHPADWWQLDCEEDATNEREERRQTSVYEGADFQAWLGRLTPAECTWQQVAELHLHIPKDRWNKALQMEISKALRAHKWLPHRTDTKRWWAPA